MSKKKDKKKDKKENKKEKVKKSYQQKSPAISSKIAYEEFTSDGQAMIELVQQDPRNLIQAIRSHDWAFCHALILLGNPVDNERYSALSYLINHSDEVTDDELYSLISELIEAGADINADDNKLLLDSIKQDSPEIVKLLLDAGANPNAYPERKSGLLFVTYERHRIITNPSFRNNTVMRTRFEKYGNIAELLIDYGAHIDKEILELAAGDTWLFDKLYQQLVKKSNN